MTEEKKTRHFPTGDTTAMKQLRERIGTAEAARMIGVSTAQFNKDVNAGEARLAYCLAARYHISRLDKQDHSTCVAVLVVPADKRTALDAVLQAMDLEVQYVVK